jgi:hypothetical protein
VHPMVMMVRRSELRSGRRITEPRPVLMGGGDADAFLWRKRRYEAGVAAQSNELARSGGKIGPTVL